MVYLKPSSMPGLILLDNKIQTGLMNIIKTGYIYIASFLLSYVLLVQDYYITYIGIWRM